MLSNIESFVFSGRCYDLVICFSYLFSCSHPFFFRNAIAYEVFVLGVGIVAVQS